MKLKKVSLAIFVVLGIIVIFLLVGYIERNEMDSIEFRKKIYYEFMEGECVAENISIDDIISVTGEPNRHFSLQYTLFDSTGDTLPELHIKTPRNYYIFTCNDKKMVLWASLPPATILFDDGTFLTENTSHVGYNDYYYFILNSSGDEIFHLAFMETESGYYEFSEVQVTKEQWQALSELYLKKSKDNIKWENLK